VETTSLGAIAGLKLNLEAIGTPFAFVEVARFHGVEGWKNYLFAIRGRKFVPSSHFQVQRQASGEV
jgi:hypothetical protein